ncbi:hypothetical protein FPZ11_13720 [Humibacter ginsenosidimutans]|uniref:TACI cysteine-rich domain-containing protein n=1 Tax=Humibacter ginsenosidimutans TaxID=2599293 RepID=A0A5B8MAS0_9MICO|nr:hypothetical protein FPZ11_13720 [Humibacter ginsenosidimutans]
MWWAEAHHAETPESTLFRGALGRSCAAVCGEHPRQCSFVCMRTLPTGSAPSTG